jgi:hypothetical protein
MAGKNTPTTINNNRVPIPMPGIQLVAGFENKGVAVGVSVMVLVAEGMFAVAVAVDVCLEVWVKVGVEVGVDVPVGVKVGVGGMGVGVRRRLFSFSSLFSGGGLVAGGSVGGGSVGHELH